MSSARLREFFKSFRFRIAANYFVLVVVSSVVLFGFLFFLIGRTLKEKDRRIIEAEYKRFSLIAEEDGVPELTKWFSARQNLSSSSDVFVRLLDADGKVLFEHDPNILKEIEGDTFKKGIDAALPGQMTRIESAKDSQDAVELYTGQLEHGMKLQVGKDTEDREELLENFQAAFSLTLFGALITAILTGLLFSRSILTPIRNLISTTDQVRKGDLASRAEIRNSGDEVDALAKFLNAMLDQNSKLINALTDSLDAVAHDIRTPLTRLRANAEQALNAPGPQQSEVLGEIMEATDQVIELLNAIFDMSEANAGALKLRIQTFPVKVFLEEIVDVYSLVAEEKSVELSLDVPADFEIRCDVRMKQAVANLLDNAIKFSPDQSLIQIRAVHQDRHSLITVEDRGPGISDNEQTKIWERLYRGDQSRSTRGMGLGLSLVRAIVQAHAGTASVRRRAGGIGSVFEILLPDA